MEKKVPMTRTGYDRLETELRQLKHVDRHAVINAIADARVHGDLSENAEYHSAKERQGFIEGRIIELEDKVSRADIIDISVFFIWTFIICVLVKMTGTTKASRMKTNLYIFFSKF